MIAAAANTESDRPDQALEAGRLLFAQRCSFLLSAASEGQLPEGWADRVAEGGTTNWATGSTWRFGEPSDPVKLLPGLLSRDWPQVRLGRSSTT